MAKKQSGAPKAGGQLSLLMPITGGALSSRSQTTIVEASPQSSYRDVIYRSLSSAGLRKID